MLKCVVPKMVETRECALSVSGLELRYGNVKALSDINLDVASGEFVALLGPSGCGKTSLLRSIAGFNFPQKGEIHLKEQNVAKLPPQERNIGIVFQNYALFPHMTVFQNVCFGLECRGLSKAEIIARALAALKLVHLEAFADRLPKRLSGGQQQRVALARAFVIEPDLLLLDEPLGALDKQLRLRMQSELKTLQRTVGVTAVFVTHDQEEALAMADRIVVMRGGAVQQVASPDVLFNQPRTGWVADFINAGNVVDGSALKVSNNEFQLHLEGELIVSGPAGRWDASRDPCLLIPFHRLQVYPASASSLFVVTAIQPNGIAFDLSITGRDRHFRAQLPINRLNEFSVGSHVSLSASACDCALIPKE